MDSYFDRGLCRLFVEFACRLAYIRFEENGRSNLVRRLERFGFQLSTTVDLAGTQAFVAESERYVALVFRGTEVKSPQDLITDLDIRLRPSRGGVKTHRGCADAYDTVRGAIRSALRRARNKPVFVVGHSLGGALAVVAAYDLEREFEVVACYTFGAPRIGDEALKRKMRTPVWAVLHAADIVARLPFFAMGFRRVGHVIFLTRDKKLVRAPEFYRMALRFMSDTLFRPLRLLRDHLGISYIDAVRTATREQD